MPESKLTVVVSAGQSRNPEKRELERLVAEQAARLPGVQVLRIPHLYDLDPKGESFQALRSLNGDLIVLSWLYDRAAHWVLDRNGIQGQVGEVELKAEVDEDQEEVQQEENVEDRVIDAQPRPNRTIYSIDLRVSSSSEEFVIEIERIAGIHSSPQGSGGTTGRDAGRDQGSRLSLDTLQRLVDPANDTYLGSRQEDAAAADSNPGVLFGTSSLNSIDEHPSRRWYPVIDFSRCTNCMECIDFCLFGVYGVDSLDTIVVEQADNCRKGCPACSRVCPQNAIIFPQHKTPAIAGAPVDSGGLKIDLSKLFGAPEKEEDALEVAARERDEQLILAGRDAVGLEAGLKERLAKSPRPGSSNPDDLDNLLDQLDSLDL